MKTMSIDRANGINEQTDEIRVGQFAVIDHVGSLLGVRDSAEAAHAIATDIEDEFDRETDVVEITEDE